MKKGAVWNSLCFLLNTMTIEHKAKPGTTPMNIITKSIIIVDATTFSTTTNNNNTTTTTTIELIDFQHYVTKCILKFLRNYSSLLFHLDGSNQNPDLIEMLTVGKSVADAIRFLRRSYSDDDERQVILVL